jgi:hypothetical protein
MIPSKHWRAYKRHGRILEFALRESLGKAIDTTYGTMRPSEFLAKPTR